MFPFDAEVLASSYALYNAAVWPAQAVALALALAAVWLAAAPRRWSGPAVAAILAAGWAWCGAVFFLQHFAQLDFMAPIYGGAFLLQALLLLWCMARRRFVLSGASDAVTAAALVLAFMAVIGLPLVTGLGGFGFASARIVGLAPDPTVLFTLAMLLRVEGRWRWLLMVLPLSWCALAGAMGWALGVPEALTVAALGLAALLAALWARRPSA
ncbi:MAG: DUF6064 family protein [Kiloniellaceae bacterium]